MRFYEKFALALLAVVWVWPYGKVFVWDLQKLKNRFLESIFRKQEFGLIFQINGIFPRYLHYFKF